jgi:basic membrane protein A
MEPMLAAAETFPDVTFMHATGFLTGDNMGHYFGAAEEGRYLSGMAAGAATESGQIGYVAAFPIPEVVRGINAFAQGVKEVNPTATVEVVWTSTWFDPPIESSAAQTLLDKGADVIAMHQDSAAPGQAADAVGAKWSGYNTDMTEFAPDAWLTAPIWNWGPFYLATAQQVIDGSWVSEAYYGNMADGTVELAPFGASVDDDTQALVLERQAGIIDGSFNIFSDPVTDQDGNERDWGNVFNDEMNWFVEGVIGSPTG